MCGPTFIYSKFYILKHIVGSQIKGSRYKGLYVLLPLMDVNEKLMNFN